MSKKTGKIKYLIINGVIKRMEVERIDFNVVNVITDTCRTIAKYENVDINSITLLSESQVPNESKIFAFSMAWMSSCKIVDPRGTATTIERQSKPLFDSELEALRFLLDEVTEWNKNRLLEIEFEFNNRRSGIIDRIEELESDESDKI